MSTLAASPASPAPTSPGKAVTLQFDDNALLPLLFGDHDRNLVRLEAGLGVRLSSRGNRIAISGAPARVQAAEAALNGRALDEEGIARAAQVAAASVDPPRDLHGSADYRRSLVATLSARALRQAQSRTTS